MPFLQFAFFMPPAHPVPPHATVHSWANIAATSCTVPTDATSSTAEAFPCDCTTWSEVETAFPCDCTLCSEAFLVTALCGQLQRKHLFVTALCGKKYRRLLCETVARSGSGFSW